MGCSGIRPIRLHDLLAHTSGIGFGPGFWYEPENDYEHTYAALVKRVENGEVGCKSRSRFEKESHSQSSKKTLLGCTPTGSHKRTNKRTNKQTNKQTN